MPDTWKPTIVDSDQPLYVLIGQALADDINSGRLLADAKLPTHRELADTLGIAIGTVSRAYAEAERRGIIRSEGRRGTFVGEPHSSRSILTAMAKHREQGIDMSKNHPAYGLDPHLSSSLRTIARQRFSQRLLEYPPAAGLPHHRESGARWFADLGVSAADPDSIFVTAGAQHAVSVILAAETKVGDVVAAESFTYPGLRAVAEQLDLQVIGVPTDKDGIIPQALDTLCKRTRVRLLYLNPTLNNPTNYISPTPRREAIADVAARYGLKVLEDEIMRPMLTERPGLIANILPEQTFLVISASKSVAAGLRVGFVRAPEEARQRLIESLNASCLGAPPLTAELFAIWLNDGTIDRLIERRRRDAAERQHVAAGMLEGLEFTGHQSSYHIWLHLPQRWTGMHLAMEAQRRGAVVTPGEAFAADGRAHVEAVRLSIVVPPTMEMLVTALTTVVDLLRGPTRHNLATV